MKACDPEAVPTRVAAVSVSGPAALAAMRTTEARPSWPVARSSPGKTLLASEAMRVPAWAATPIRVPAVTTFPNASRTGPSVTVEALRPSAVRLSRVVANAIEPAGAAGPTVALPPEPAPPPARSAPIPIDSTTVSRPTVAKRPEPSGPDAGLHTREPEGRRVTVAVSVVTKFPNASIARTRTLSGMPAAQASEAGATRRDAVGPGWVTARTPTGVSGPLLTKTESIAGAVVGGR